MGSSDTLLTVGILALGGGALYYLLQSGALGNLTQSLNLGQGVGLPQTEERQEAVEEGMGEIFDEGKAEAGEGGDEFEVVEVIEEEETPRKKKSSKKSSKKKGRGREDEDDEDEDQRVFPNYQQARQQYPYMQQYPRQVARPPAPGLVSSRYQYQTPPEQQVSLTKTTYSPYSPYNQFYQYYQYQQYPQGFLLPDDNVFFTDITRDGSRNYTDPRYHSSRSCIDCTSECAMNPYSYGCKVCRPQCKRAGTTPYQNRFVLGPAQQQGAFLATIWNTLTDGFQDMDAYRERKEKFDCHNKLLRKTPRERYNKKMVENSDYSYDRTDINIALPY